MKCVILATTDQAGEAPGDFRPLWRLHGLSLLERAVLSARWAGCREILVVATQEAQRVREQLADWAVNWQPEVQLKLVTLPEEPHMGMLAALAALRGVIDEPFLFFGADRLFDPRLLASLVHHDMGEQLVTLAVDSERENPVVDAERVIRVRRLDDGIEDLGPKLEWYDGLATGLAKASPEFLEHVNKDGQETLEALLRRLAEEGRVGALDVTGRFWCPIEDSKRLKPCGRAFLRHVRTDLDDGLIARWFNRPFSIQLSRLLVHFRVRPGQMAGVGFILSAVAAWLLAQGTYPYLVAGGVLAQVAAMVGGSDSELARLKLLDERHGGWLGRLFDHYADTLLLLGAAWPYANETGLVMVAAYFALSGSAALALTAGRYRRCLAQVRKEGRLRLAWWLGRDSRIFVLLLGALADALAAALVILALLAHFESLRRLLACRFGDLREN